jgi:hypothetical protein
MRTLTCALFSLALLLPACGGGASTGTDPVVGSYGLDVERTSGGGAAPGDVARRKGKFGADAYRVDVLADGSFRTTVRMSDEPFEMTGTWEHAPTGLVLRTTAVNGEPPPPEHVTVESAVVEGDALVLGPAEQRIYLRRL